jgi:hypothetical protein
MYFFIQFYKKKNPNKYIYFFIHIYHDEQNQ